MGGNCKFCYYFECYVWMVYWKQLVMGIYS